MHIAGQGKGSKYRNIKCSANHSKGAEICPNGASISERKAHVGLVETVRASLQDEALFTRFDSTFAALWKQEMNELAAAPETAALDAEIQKTEGKVARLAGLVAENNDIEALLRQLRVEEAKLKDQRAERAAVVTKVETPPPPPFPSMAQLSTMFDDVVGTLSPAPHAARKTLAARFGPVVLTPLGDGRWKLATTLKMNPAALVGGRKYATEGVAGAR